MGGHNLAEGRAVGGQEVDHTVGEAGITEDLVDQVVRHDGGVAGLPEGHISLKEY